MDPLAPTLLCSTSTGGTTRRCPPPSGTVKALSLTSYATDVRLTLVATIVFIRRGVWYLSTAFYFQLFTEEVRISELIIFFSYDALFILLDHGSFARIA